MFLTSMEDLYKEHISPLKKTDTQDVIDSETTLPSIEFKKIEWTNPEYRTSYYE